MKVTKLMAAIAIAASTSLFANGISNVSALVEEINKTSDAKEKQVLMKKLEIELSVIDKKDLSQAKEIIDTKLKK